MSVSTVQAHKTLNPTAPLAPASSENISQGPITISNIAASSLGKRKLESAQQFDPQKKTRTSIHIQDSINFQEALSKPKEYLEKGELTKSPTEHFALFKENLEIIGKLDDLHKLRFPADGGIQIEINDYHRQLRGVINNWLPFVTRDPIDDIDNLASFAKFAKFYCKGIHFLEKDKKFLALLKKAKNGLEAFLPQYIKQPGKIKIIEDSIAILKRLHEKHDSLPDKFSLKEAIEEAYQLKNSAEGTKLEEFHKIIWLSFRLHGVFKVIMNSKENSSLKTMINTTLGLGEKNELLLACLIWNSKARTPLQLTRELEKTCSSLMKERSSYLYNQRMPSSDLKNQDRITFKKRLPCFIEILDQQEGNSTKQVEKLETDSLLNRSFLLNSIQVIVGLAMFGSGAAGYAPVLFLAPGLEIFKKGMTDFSFNKKTV
jgi:hypothetical protein